MTVTAPPPTDDLLARVADHATPVCTAADRDVWLTARRDSLGGSDAAKVAGLDEFGSPSSVYLDKVAGVEQADNPAMEWGRRLEPAVAAKFADETGLDLIDPQTLWRSTAWPWLHATPDRLTSDGGLLEIKNTSRWRADLWDDDQVPDHALLQGIHYLAVTGLDRAHFAVLIDGRDFRRRTVERGDVTQVIGQLVEIESRFWHDHVLARVPPPADSSEATTRALARLYATVDRDTTIDLDGADFDGRTAGRLVDDLCEVTARIKQLQDEERGLRNELRAALGHADLGRVDGITAVTWREGAYTQVDLDALRADHPDLVESYTTRGTRRTLRVTAAWKNRLEEN